MVGEQETRPISCLPVMRSESALDAYKSFVGVGSTPCRSRIERYAKVDTPMAEVRREDRHNAIEREIISIAPSVPNFRLPEDG